MAGPITIASSGFKSADIIDQMVKYASLPMLQLQKQQGVLAARKDEYQKILTALTAFNSLAQGMDSPNQFSKIAATSTDPGVVTAVAGAGASAGSYTIEVMQLAAAQRSYSDAFASASVAGQLAPGTLTLQSGSNNAVAIVVDGSSTLDSVAASINGAAAGIQANVIYDGQAYRLQVTALSDGSANAITFGESGTAFNLGAPQNLAQGAQDAQIKLDNFTTITRSSNVIDDLIGGVTLQLQKVSSVPETITLGVSTDALVAEVQAYIANYNNLMAAVNAATAVMPATPGAPADPKTLVGDPTVRGLVRDLQDLLGTPVAHAAGSYTTLSQIGVSTQQDGTLALDVNALTTAIARDPTGVMDLFVQDPNTGSSGVAAGLGAVWQHYGAFGLGGLSTMLSSIATQTQDLNGSIQSMARGLDSYRQVLQQQYTSYELIMSNLNRSSAYLEQLQAVSKNMAR